ATPEYVGMIMPRAYARIAGSAAGVRTQRLTERRTGRYGGEHGAVFGEHIDLAVRSPVQLAIDKVALEVVGNGGKVIVGLARAGVGQRNHILQRSGSKAPHVLRNDVAREWRAASSRSIASGRIVHCGQAGEIAAANLSRGNTEQAVAALCG